MVRTARRLAGELNAEWLALYVETPQLAAMPPKKRERVNRILQLAEELGARSQVLPSGGSIHATTQTIMEFAHKNNVTKIIAGKPLRPRWQEFMHGSLVDHLIHESGDIDVYVVTSSDRPTIPPEENPLQLHSPLSRYLWSLLLLIAATVVGKLLGGSIEPTNLVMVYLLIVVIAAVYLGRGPAILASILGVLAFDFFFVLPYFNFGVSDTQYVITFIALLLVGLVISQLTVRAREQAEAAQQREAETAELYDLSRDLAATADLDAILRALIYHCEQSFHRETVILLPEGNRLTSRLASVGLYLSDEETAVADWVYRHGEPAGRHTSTLPAAELRYLPLKTARGVVGAVGVGKPGTAEGDLNPAQRRVMEAFANQAAQAIERVILAEEARQIKLLQEAEKLQNALLNSISHDLRTPLVSITGSLTSLDEQSDSLTEENRKSLILTAREEADRLNRLVGNLLSMTRIESGAIHLHLEPGDLQDVIGTALEQLGKRVADHQIQVSIRDEYPLVPMDFTLIVQVLVNVLENAVKYSSEGSLIEITADQHEGKARLQIADRGVGIPANDLEHVFDKFYRVQRPESASGTGLGLSISKGIVDIHHGTITACAREGGGTIIEIELPFTGKDK